MLSHVDPSRRVRSLASPFWPRLLAVVILSLGLILSARAVPTVTVLNPAPDALVGTLTTVKVTFSEAVTGIDAKDLLINNEETLSMTGTGAGPYTFTFTQPPPGLVSVSWDFDHGITGIGTGAFVPTVGWSYTLSDIIAPTILSRTPAPGATVGAVTQAEIIFSEAVTGVDAADLLVNGTPALNVTGSGQGPYVFTYTQPGPGVVAFSWAASHGITDVATPPNAFVASSWNATRSATGAGTLIITEFLAANATSIADEDLEQNDWIEIYNPGTASVNLIGWSLTSDSSQPSEWVFPSRTIAAGAYLIVFASGKDRKPAAPSNLHTNFKINENGGYLALMSPDYPRIAVSSYDPYPVQRYDYSYGIQAGGGLRYFARALPVTNADARPGAANPASTLTGITPKPTVSVGRGFFKEPFSVIISAVAGATIRYTLDGTEPTVGTGTVYTAPLSVSATTILRAAAFGATTIPSETTTHSYIYLDTVFGQNSPPYDDLTNATDNANPAPPFVGTTRFPVSWGTQAGVGFPGLITNLAANTIPADYGMDTKIYNDASKYDDNGLVNAATGKTNLSRIKQGLRDLPILSIVLKTDDMFGTGGLYPNSNTKLPVNEKSCSVEMILPDGSTGFATTCGIRIHGNASRSPASNPKHGFKLKFKGDFGASSLKYQLFPDSPVDSLDDLILRADYNSSWLHWDGVTQRPKGTRTRDAFSKDTFRAMGRIAGHHRYVNLFINGVYWGTYDPSEQETDAFAANYLGGDSSTYDVYEQGTLKSGTSTAYVAMTSITSLNVNSNYELMKQYLDMPWFIDYMLLHFWEGHQDWGDDINKNWYAVRNRAGNGLFRYLPWDMENLLWDQTVDRTTVTLPASGLHPKLLANGQYRMDFADRVQKHMVAPDGALLPAAAIARWNKWRSVLTNAIAGESARWGDYRLTVHQYSAAPYPLYTWNGAGVTEHNRLIGTYFPVRTSNVLTQLRTQGLYPSLNAGEYRDNTSSALITSKTVPAGYQLKMVLPSPAPTGTTSTGSIYYTTDGSDPRVYYTGALSASAKLYSSPITINATTVLKMRVVNGTPSATFNVWSALNEMTLTVGFTNAPVRITEIMYNPPAANGGTAAEFLEFQNTSTQTVDLGGWFLEGVNFIFPNGTTLAAGNRLVLANDTTPGVFATQYPGVSVFGYFGGSLDNGGERVALHDSSGRVLISVDYKDNGAWPTSPDGGGNSLEVIDPNGDPDSPANWRASNALKGTPGQANSAIPAATVILNEILARNTGAVPLAGGAYDFIELKNTGGSAVDLSGWTISVGTNLLTLPAGTSIAAAGFLVVPCSATAPGALHLPAELQHEGGTVVLSNPANVRIDAIQYGNQVANLSIGRTPDLWVLTNPSPGADNSAAALAPLTDVSLNEWLANANPGGSDWIELFNKNATLPVALKGLFIQAAPELYRVASLSFLPPRDYLQLFCDGNNGVDHVDFKLTAAGGSLALLDSTGIAFESLTYGAQSQGVTQGRLPDGTATIASFSKGGSPAAANYVLSYSGPILNEVLARNVTGPLSPFGTHAGWVELYNPGASSVDLGGMKLGALKDAPSAWIIPSGTTIGAQSYLVIWCDPTQAVSLSASANLNSGLALGGSSGQLYLFTAANQLADLVEWGFQIADQSIGLDAGAWKLLTTPSLGAANASAAPLGSVSTLRINEWMATPISGSDWFELYNPGTLPVDMSGLFLTDDPSELGVSKFQVPALSYIAATGFVKWEASGSTDLGRNHVNFTLDGGGESIRLSKADGSQIEMITFGIQTTAVSQGRVPDGSATIDFMPGSPTPGAPNVELPAPSFTLQPVGQTVSFGANVTFSVAATGSAPLTFQWKLNGTPIASATATTLQLNAVGAANDGIYTCVATNTAGSATSNSASLIVKLTYAQWAAAKGVGAPEEDPDKDGITNIGEYFYNTNPTVPATAGERAALAQIALEPGSPAVLTLTYRRSLRADIGALQYQLAPTMSPLSWANATPTSVDALSADPVTGDPRFKANFSLAPEDTRKFARLLLTP